ncbi:hypothetical protein ACFQS3_02340 [Glycomyces mayteni]|uniref:Uncharacterized protein n=1 Tax=Glycomyces mayteni TaxID=543887 RepID=A0ABW2D3J9_9ACTN
MAATVAMEFTVLPTKELEALRADRAELAKVKEKHKKATRKIAELVKGDPYVSAEAWNAARRPRSGPDPKPLGKRVTYGYLDEAQLSPYRAAVSDACVRLAEQTLTPRHLLNVSTVYETPEELAARIRALEAANKEANRQADVLRERAGLELVRTKKTNDALRGAGYYFVDPAEGVRAMARDLQSANNRADLYSTKLGKAEKDRDAARTELAKVRTRVVHAEGYLSGKNDGFTPSRVTIGNQLFGAVDWGKAGD